MKTLKHRLTLALLIVYMFGICQPLLAETCVNVLASNAPIERIKDGLAGFINRIKPIVSNEDFNLRIVSTPKKELAFSPRKLQVLATENFVDIKAKLEEMGFELQYYTQMLIEAQPRVVKMYEPAELNRSPRVVDKLDVSPAVYEVYGLFPFALPNYRGVYKLRQERSVERGDFPFPPVTLVMTAISKTFHSLAQKFILAHEMAHITENTLIRKGNIWTEARADLIAYLLTGETNIELLEPIQIEKMNSLGEVSKVEVSKIRSLSAPEITGIEKLIPDQEKYHFNSELISSALYDLGSKLDQGNLISFIHWMDKIPSSVYYHQEKNVRVATHSSDFQQVHNQFGYTRFAQDLLEIRIEVRTLAFLIRKWSKETLLEGERVFVEETLQERGL